MEFKDKTKEDLIKELSKISQRIVELEKSEARLKKAEEDLRKEREFKEKTINALMDTFFVFSPRTEKAILWNKRFQEVSGYTDEEITSLKAPDSYYSPEDLERAAATTGEVLNNGQGKVEMSLICKDGKRIPTEYLASLIKDEEGKPKYIISIGRDITERKRVEGTLLESTERFQRLSEATFEGIALSEGGKVIDCNQQIADMLGFSVSEIIGINVADFVAPESRESVREHIIKDYSDPYEHLALKKDGTVINVEVRGKKILYQGRTVRETIIRDVTDRKKAEEELRKSEESLMIKDSAIESSLSAIGITDSDGKLLYVNKSLLQMWGYENKDEVLGRSLPEFWDGDRVYITIENTLKKGGDIGEDRGKRKDGSVFDVQFSSSLIKDKAGQPKYFFGSFLDITERKKAEKEQERLTAKLIAKNKELEQVLYVTSHDLRSPLVNVDGYSKELDYSLKELMSSVENEQVPSSIKEKIAPIVEEDIPESLHYIRISVLKMETLLKGILTLSRLGRSELKIEKLDMNEMMTYIVDSHRFRLNELEIKMEVSKLPHSKGDSSQINQVFSNILDNAIKYSDSERHCFINISGYKDKNYSVYCIEDNGLGIAPAHQDKIFEIFHQLEPNRFKGEGMGLTIANRMLEKQNGKIWVESELDKGSKFFVSLPKA